MHGVMSSRVCSTSDGSVEHKYEVTNSISMLPSSGLSKLLTDVTFSYNSIAQANLRGLNVNVVLRTALLLHFSCTISALSLHYRCATNELLIYMYYFNNMFVYIDYIIFTPSVRIYRTQYEEGNFA